MNDATKPNASADANVLNQMAPADARPKKDLPGGEPRTTQRNPDTEPLTDADFKFEKINGSSQIAEMAHARTTLRVKFHPGTVYEYGGVSRELYEEIKNDPDSVGKAFNAKIKSKPSVHPYRKI